MNEELSYAEMLEIPVETVTVNRKEKKRRAKEDLAEQVVETVNDRVESDDPAYAAHFVGGICRGMRTVCDDFPHEYFHDGQCDQHICARTVERERGGGGHAHL